MKKLRKPLVQGMAGRPQRRLRQFTALLLTALLALTGLSGCAAAGDGDSPAKTVDLRGLRVLGDLLGLETNIVGDLFSVTPSDSTGVKIGVSLWAEDDPLSRETIATIDRAAALLGVEVEYAFCDYDSRRIRRSVSDLIDAGCDAILLSNRSDSDIAAAIRVCDEKGVYLAQLSHWIAEDLYPETYALAQASPYYIGAVHGEERTVSYRLVNALLEVGDRNIGYITWDKGDTTQIQRDIGFHMATESFRGYYPKAVIRLADPVEAATAEEGYRAFKRMIEEEPELEAVLISGGGGDVLDGVLAAVSEMGLVGAIDVAAFDATDSMRPLMTSGAVFAAASGTYCQGLYGFLMLLQAVQGNYTKVPGETGMDLTIADLYMYSSTNGRNYDDSFVLDVPYTDREILDLAALPAEDLAKAFAGLTLTDVLDRHARETFDFPSLSSLLSSDDEEEEELSEEEQREEDQAEEAREIVEDLA